MVANDPVIASGTFDYVIHGHKALPDKLNMLALI
jgi:hypothetical protein